MLVQVSWKRYQFDANRAPTEQAFELAKNNPAGVRAASRRDNYSGYLALLREYRFLWLGGVLAIVGFITWPAPPAGWWDIPWYFMVGIALLVPLSFVGSSLSYLGYLIRRRQYMRLAIRESARSANYAEFVRRWGAK